MERLRGGEKTLRTLNHPLRAVVGVAAGATIAALLLTAGTRPAISSELKKPTFVMAHGVDAQAADGFIGEVGRQLRQQGYEVIEPQLPLGEKQNIDDWTSHLFEQTIPPKLSGPVFGIGYSGGVQPFLHIIHENPGYLCGFYGLSGALKGNKQALYRDFSNPRKIMDNVGGNAGLIHAQNDGILPLEQAVALSIATGIPILDIDPEAGHFLNLSPNQITPKIWKVLTHVKSLAEKC